jgi:demethylmenaquinone methyltransferase/2-methoxy-6-polyprenyl-1,4-benzoquinol methylase
VTHLQGEERARFVRRMFARLAETYDAINRVMTFWQDLKWRRESVAMLGTDSKELLLDLGTGTGDMLFEIQRQFPQAMAVGVDFTPEMITLARNRQKNKNAYWVIADVHHLPFPHLTFHGTLSAFLLRNLPHVQPVIQEQYRVLQNGGVMVCLETSPPPPGPLQPILKRYFDHIIPIIGKWLAKDPEAYTYLSRSIEKFLEPDQLAHRFQSEGFQDVKYVRRMMGTIAIHRGEKCRMDDLESG